MRRSSAHIAIVIAFALNVVPARASDTQVRGPGQACIEAHADGLAQRDAGRLLAAKEGFLSCAEEQCPLEIRKECAALCEGIIAATPSVVFAATDERGQDLSIASVAIDGWPVEAARSLSVEVDPGAHEVELRLLDGRNRRVHFVVRAGEKYRKVPVVFDSERRDERPGPVSPSAAPTNTLAYLLGGAGALALGAFVYFGLDGKSQQHDLDRCKPDCSRRDVDRMRKALLLADISLGVSLASLGVGGYLLLRDTNTSPRPANGSPAEIGLTARGHF